jgi:hypothetical protein
MVACVGARYYLDVQVPQVGPDTDARLGAAQCALMLWLRSSVFFAYYWLHFFIPCQGVRITQILIGTRRATLVVSVSAEWVR